MDRRSFLRGLLATTAAVAVAPVVAKALPQYGESYLFRVIREYGDNFEGPPTLPSWLKASPEEILDDVRRLWNAGEHIPNRQLFLSPKAARSLGLDAR